LNNNGLEVAFGAVEIYRELIKKGISIRKSKDCLVAQYGLKYNLKILHKDRDFDRITEHYK
jgi:predicted nucleic acid-binding protein